MQSAYELTGSSLDLSSSFWHIPSNTFNGIASTYKANCDSEYTYQSNANNFFHILSLNVGYEQLLKHLI